MVRSIFLRLITNRKSFLMLLGLHSLVSVVINTHAVADTQNISSTKNWVCEWCELDQGIWGYIDLGIGNVDENTTQFGLYNGLFEDSAYALGNIELNYQDNQAFFYHLKAFDLGLDSRSLSLNGGKQGQYKIWLRYSKLPYKEGNNTLSPFLGAASTSLSLPSNWVFADNTQNMANLRTSLHPQDFKNERTTTELGTVLHLGHFGEVYSLNYEQIKKQGERISAAAFGINDGFSAKSTQLIEPIDHVNDQLTLSIAYDTNIYHWKLSYFGSLFRNNNSELTWTNPYSLTPDTLQGRYSLAPDNEFHQLSFTGSYKLFDHTHFTWSTSTGIMTQNDKFTSYSINPSFAIPLSARSLDARVNTWNLNAKLASRFNNKLFWDVKYSQDDYDNKTNQFNWTYVVADTIQSANGRTNPVYSFRNRKLSTKAKYVFDKHKTLIGGVEYRNNNRTQQAVSKSSEITIWNKLNYKFSEMVNTSIKASAAKRSINNYQPVAGVVEPENNLLRKYNLANRERSSIDSVISYAFSTQFAADFSINLSQDDYNKSSIGLQSADIYSYSLDANYSPNENYALTVFFGQERYKSTQSGSQNFATPDWWSKNKDTLLTTGISLTYANPEKPNTWGAEYVYSRAKQNQELVGSIVLTNQELPVARNNRKILRLFFDHQYNERTIFKFSITHEKYDESDYSLDNIDTDTYLDFLSLSNATEDYAVTLMSFSIKHTL